MVRRRLKTLPAIPNVIRYRHASLDHSSPLSGLPGARRALARSAARARRAARKNSRLQAPPPARALPRSSDAAIGDKCLPVRCPRRGRRARFRLRSRQGWSTEIDHSHPRYGGADLVRVGAPAAKTESSRQGPVRAVVHGALAGVSPAVQADTRSGRILGAAVTCLAHYLLLPSPASPGYPTGRHCLLRRRLVSLH